ncbi:hypothetical protein V8E54_005144 [Elaphomyces granulatus]
MGLVNFTQIFHLDQYLNYEYRWHDEFIYLIERGQKRYDSAWKQLVDSKVLRPRETEQFIWRRVSELADGRVKEAQFDLDTAQKERDSVNLQSTAIKIFLKRTFNETNETNNKREKFDGPGYELGEQHDPKEREWQDIRCRTLQLRDIDGNGDDGQPVKRLLSSS